VPDAEVVGSWWRRLALGVVLVAASFALDPWAWWILRNGTAYDHWAEMRELLAAAKFLGSGLGTALIAMAIGSLDAWRRAGVLAVAVVAASAAAGVVKVATGRERPSRLDQLPGQERRWSFHGPVEGLTHSTFQSFPSGHTAGAFASATALSALYPPVRPVFWTVAVACGVNRVVKHQHFLSDVVAGAVVGHLVAWWVVIRPRTRRWIRPDGVDTRSRSP
jgi:membrane-associated phospholipid phosphatase